MKMKKLLMLLLTLVVCISALPVSAEGQSTSVLSLSSNLSEGQSPKLGDEITYTVSLSKNDGIAGGTVYFVPSDNLEYVSATFKGESRPAELAEYGENPGAYGVRFMGEIFTDNYESFCSITFKVVNEGTAQVRFYPFQLTNGEPVEPTVQNATVSHAVAELQKPVIETALLPEAVKGYGYSARLSATDIDFLTFSLVDGSLPAGLSLAPDGTVSGTPTVYGDFTFTVKATLLNKLDSDVKEITISILEKPRKLELTSESIYNIDEGDYLVGVKARTKASDIISSFKNHEYVKLFDSKGNEITSSSAFIGTGCTVSLMHGDEKVHTVTVVVKGDTDGDGRITSLDYTFLRLHYMKKSALSGAYLNAAHVDNDGRVTSVDYFYIRLHYMGEFDIYSL